MKDWQRVGLEAPSTDLGAIKRAYAKAVKVTRPDDDPVAYQELREAYDRLVQRARHVAAMQAREQAAAQEEAESVVEVAAEVTVEATVEATAETTAERREAVPGAGSDTTPDASSEAEAKAEQAAELRAEPQPSPTPTPTPEPEPKPEPELEPEPEPKLTLQPEAPGPTPATQAPHHEPVRDTAAAITPPAVELPPPPPAPRPAPADRFELLSPAALAQWLNDRSLLGRDALIAALPQLRDQLNHQPFEWRVDSSVQMARLVLNNSADWPAQALNLLFEHFDWFDMGRTRHELGDDAALALTRMADDCLERPIHEAHLLRQFGEAIAFSRLMGQRRKSPFWECFIMALLKPVLELQLQWMSPALWRRFGFAPSYKEQRWKLAFQWGRAAQWAFAVLSVLLMYCALRGSWGFGIDAALQGVVATVAAMGLARIEVFVVLKVREWKEWERVTHALRLTRLPLDVIIPCIGLGLLAVAALGDLLATHADQEVGILMRLLVVPGAFLALPRDFRQAMIPLLLVPYFQHFHGLFYGLTGYGVILWGMLGAQAYAQGWVRVDNGEVTTALIRFPKKSLSDWVLLGTVGLPVLLAWITDRAGFYTVMFAWLLADAVALTEVGVHGPWALPVMWLALAAVLGIQRLAATLGLHVLRRLVPQPH
ncbi:hypothetical protein OU995_19255 [Roseateles sp. SL47]|uniref:hypothetical protein n=1 Tax=Roseateles sp. SL47 TaxID=2995138 RepID=UPI00226FE928|nr:hypothetical protein [Roseateles sp. SL47]WAC71706.1 hypothetical protein OU995_19255 [Roseateles sp. SL47]